MLCEANYCCLDSCVMNSDYWMYVVEVVLSHHMSIVLYVLHCMFAGLTSRDYLGNLLGEYIMRIHNMLANKVLCHSVAPLAVFY